MGFWSRRGDWAIRRHSVAEQKINALYYLSRLRAVVCLDCSGRKSSVAWQTEGPGFDLGRRPHRKRNAQVKICGVASNGPKFSSSLSWAECEQRSRGSTGRNAIRKGLFKAIKNSFAEGGGGRSTRGRRHARSLQVFLWYWRTRVCVDPVSCDVSLSGVRNGSRFMPAHFSFPSKGKIRAKDDIFKILFKCCRG